MLLEYDDFIYEPDDDDVDEAFAKIFGEYYNVEVTGELVGALWDTGVFCDICDSLKSEFKDYFYDKAMAQKQEEQEDADYFKQVEKDYWSDIL